MEPAEFNGLIRTMFSSIDPLQRPWFALSGAVFGSSPVAVGKSPYFPRRPGAQTCNTKQSLCCSMTIKSDHFSSQIMEQ